MEEDYLDESFDPKDLKVAQLRRILLEQNVRLQSGLKKAELCSLFEKHVRPKREQLLRERDLGPTVAIEKATDSSFSREVSSANSETPFSDVNDFQKEKKKKKKKEKKEKKSGESRKRKVEDDTSNERVKQRKSKIDRAVGETEGATPVVGSPLMNKVRSMSPAKQSPHKVLAIEAFESSSTSSSESSSPVSDELDSLLKRKFVSPDFSNLKVSPEFAQKLANLSSPPHTNSERAIPSDEDQVEDTVGDNETIHENTREKVDDSDKADFNNLPSFSSQDQGKAGLENSPAVDEVTVEKSSSGLAAKPISSEDSVSEEVQSSREASAEIHASTDNQASPEVVLVNSSEDESPSDNEVQSSGDAAVSSDADATSNSGDLNELEKTTSEQKISTPELATEDDVKEMNETIEAVNANEPAAEPSRIYAWLKALGSGLWKLSLFCMVMVPILFGLWYREERIHVGYCGQEINLPTFENPNNTPWIEELESFLQDRKPQCLPCPENAICYPYMKIKCKPDYVVKSSKWSLQGLFPISKYCAKDSRREKLIAEVVKKSLELLRMKNGNVKCGDGPNDYESGISEEDLYKIFHEARTPSITDEEFDDLWAQVVKDLRNEPEISWRQIQVFGNETSGNSDDATKTDDFPEQAEHLQSVRENGILRSSSKKYIGLRCKFEREVYQTYQRFKYVMWALLTIIITIKVITLKLRNYFKRQEKIESVTKKVVAKLQKCARESDDATPPYLSTVQLRDVLLSDVVDLKLKNKLWTQVVRKLEHNNTNVKSTLMELHGEIMKCWEWVGPLQEDE